MRFIPAALLGIVAGFAPLVLGVIGLLVAVAMAFWLVALSRQRYRMVAALCGGVAFAWGAAALITMRDCAGTQTYCGNATTAPLWVGVLVFLLVSALSLYVATRGARIRSDS